MGPEIPRNLVMNLATQDWHAANGAAIQEDQTASVQLGRRFVGSGRLTGCAFSVLVILLGIPETPPLYAQSTRAEKIQAERQEKAATSQPERVSNTEGRLNAIKDKKLLERFAFGYHGLTVVLGGLGTGQGFALGPQYLRSDLGDGNILIRSSARYAFAEAYLLDAVLSMPRLANDRLFLDFAGQHRNYPRIDYYGPGMDSKESDRTHFRLEDTALDATVGVRPVAPLSLGASVGALFVNTGPGNLASSRPRTEDVFSGQAIPGLADQTNFLKGAAFIQLDYRDNPGGPRTGGNYVARYTYFDDRELKRHDFRRLDVELQQYVPFFNGRRVIALRARTILTYPNGDASVPFYMQTVLGGSDDLRGFRPYRFYGDHQILLNAEYRWESFTGLEMAAFFDAGKVVPERSDINFQDLETSAGFGFRFNVRNNTFIRIDTGFSREGFLVWFKFANPF